MRYNRLNDENRQILPFKLFSKGFLLSGALLLAVACTGGLESSDTGQFHIADFAIYELSRDERPHNQGSIVPLTIDYPADEKGIIFYEYKGIQYYHPVRIGLQAIVFIRSYYQTDNVEYLTRAELYAQKLLEICDSINGTLYFPYGFDFPLHNIEEDKLIAPWYSGMAQGIVLSLFVRLYNLTANPYYLEAADTVFRSFTNLRGESEPWTVRIDDADYYWIEEYPQVTSQVLNGFIYAIYGLYDYYLLKKISISKELLQGALTTIYHYLPSYRNKGSFSYYCLRHKTPSKYYHKVHIKQLIQLWKITGEEYFWTMALEFYKDYHDPSWIFPDLVERSPSLNR